MSITDVIRHQNMMATGESNFIEKFNNFTVQDENTEKLTDLSACEDTLEYGLPLKEVYKLAYNFYKGKFNETR